jgi:soluble lytic murein transglycosylase-like protein
VKWLIALALWLGVSQHQAVERALELQGGSSAQAPIVAKAILEWAEPLGLDPAWVVGIIGVENRTLNPTARSTAGARGIMQVMPLHRATYRIVCGGDDLTNPAVNVCMGMHLLASYTPKSGNRVTAQTRYLGCGPSRCPSYHRAVARNTAAAVEVRERIYTPSFGATP